MDISNIVIIMTIILGVFHLGLAQDFANKSNLPGVLNSWMIIIACGFIIYWIGKV